MPRKPLHPCRYVGCQTLTDQRYCTQHQPVPKNENRPNAYQRGYNSRWQKVREVYLSTYPWCTECQRNDKRTAATLVDHIIPHRGDMQLFWDKNNWQGLCHSCHSRKTAKEDGGFGNSSK